MSSDDERRALAVYTMLLMLIVLKNLSKTKTFGPFVRALLKNIVDIASFLVIQLALVAGFTLVFFLL